ncbi:hypothetical protein L9F63_002521 [Diploptera punctata]|uniref:Outer dense fiber protein 3 n=1 Tax=Diploptera punctata TaxID=6984 RepID=A0AAD8ED66_DIPPU|nr:hypothetical protein L9F63_002521 [Diploptera punctata]
MAGRSGPGPGTYMLPPTVGYDKHDITRKRNPAYSMAVKTSVYSKKPSPGPYSIKQNQTRFGDTYNPAYSMGIKTALVARDKVPGPGTYAPEKCPPMKETRPPAYTIGARTPLHKAGLGPGPNQYSVPTTVGVGPRYTMTGKPGGLKCDKSPGPAKYDPTNLNIYKQKAPRVTITGRTAGVSDRSRNPGPAAYCPMYRPCRGGGQITFGVKHSDNSPPLILEEDNF